MREDRDGPSHPKGVFRTTVGKSETIALPEDMEKLVDETRAVITPQQAEYRDVFSTQEELLGQCDLIHYEKRLKGSQSKFLIDA